MGSKTLHRSIISSELNCVRHLKQYGLFSQKVHSCPGKRGNTCKGEMEISVRRNGSGRKSNVSWICKRSSCRTSRSIWSSSNFFTWKNKDGHASKSLTLCEIVEIVFKFLYTNSTTEQITQRTKRSKSSIIAWMSLCREVCEL